MDRDRYDQFVRTFFECDPAEIAGVFAEFLGAMTAEESLPPGVQMSQNYATARSNPEIHNLPGNLKDARDAVFPYFWGTDGWSSPLHLENVRGPANYASLVGVMACLLKNPNLCTDSYSQRSNELEVKAITALANLLFYHTQDPWGVFTSGGTVSNFYGLKIGVEKVLPGAMTSGLGGARVVGLASDAGHYCNRTVAGWMGLGTDQLIVVPSDANFAMRLDLLEAKLEELYQSGAKVAFVVGTFGTTDAFGCDDLAGIRRLIDAKSSEYGVPAPQLHADAAVGWALCFLSDYDLGRDPLGAGAAMHPVVERVQAACRGLRHADSVTLDFHKLGRGHYPSSAFIVNRREDLKYLARDVSETPYFSDAEVGRDPALFTLETSRAGLGPYSVMASLDAIGLQGWQMLMLRGLELAEVLKSRLDALDYCQVLNRDTTGINVCFWVLPRGRDARAIYRDLVAGRLSRDEAARYLGEVRRLFLKRERGLNPATDARLGYTSSVGFHPHGYDLPAWKAVFMNPRTDEGVIERILASIEEVA